ncbi:protein adenylyltransferase SelO family protein [Sphingomonas glaciei]|uniref:Protein nucleotidyltransferase YdiU n=1 Tax=Sphingomonas glaciei TaxID=2938948 RepID=A0ABY5MX43_9SPHN|nr:YdiU family protein [Sphingomonas glaciei]UUR09024.1 YdiU family protein [Sphingomonas glaciei]
MTPVQPYQPDPRILELGDGFYDPVRAAEFPACTARFVNERAAAEVGLESADWARHFCRFEPLPGNLEAPLALRYHGHQFRSYNPELGDGRGFLFAQLRDRGGRLTDLGTKGSGQTPWSRFGDGRLTLKGGVREVLATEMLEALGVNTSRTFALFETGEELQRNDEPSPARSAVLTRLSHGHIRIGTFQRLAFGEDVEGLERLVSYCLEHLYGEPADGGAERLFALVTERTAALAASYMVAGFVHGVLNTDNINITGESFDYGPWRFAPTWEPGFTAAYFDHSGLYAFGRQPEAIQWNLAQLAGCLALLTDGHERLQASLEGFAAHFHAALSAGMVRRLGLTPAGAEEDRVVARAVVAALGTGKVGIDRFFFDWFGGARPTGEAYADPAFEALAEAIGDRRGERRHAYWSDAQPCSILIDEVEAIWAAIASDDDWAPFEDKVAAIRRMGEALTETAGSASSPTP